MPVQRLPARTAQHRPRQTTLVRCLPFPRNPHRAFPPKYRLPGHRRRHAAVLHAHHQPKTRRRPGRGLPRARLPPTASPRWLPPAELWRAPQPILPGQAATPNPVTKRPWKRHGQAAKWSANGHSPRPGRQAAGSGCSCHSQLRWKESPALQSRLSLVRSHDAYQRYWLTAQSAS